MKKNAFYLLLLLSVLVLSCRSEEAISEKTEFAEQITSFKKFEEKIASDLSYRARHLQNFEKKAKTNSHKSMQKTSSTIDIPISDVSYKIPFRETIENYFANHSDYAQSFYATFGQPFYAVSTYTYGYNGNAVKAIAFPIVKEGLVTGIIHGVVSANRDFVYFTVVQNTDSTTQKVITDLQYEIDNLYPKGPEIMSRLIVEREARQREIEEVTLYYLQDRSGGGGGVWNIFLPNNYWYRDTNIIFEGNGGAGAGGAMSGGASKHNTKFPDYLDPNDPCANAKAGVNKANTTLADARIKTDFTDKMKNIAASSTNSETGMTIGKDSNGNIKVTEPITVTGTAGQVPAAPAGYNAIADGHNHNYSNPPSPGDLWTMMENLVNNPYFETRYVFGQDGSIYALTVNDRQAAIDFLAAYPRSQYLKPNSGDFIQDLSIPIYNDFRGTLERFQNILPTNNEATTATMAYIMDKYRMGISISKSNGTKLEAVNAQQNPDGTYSKSTCN